MHRSSRPSPGSEPFHGHRAGEPGFRRLALAVFVAGLATFALLYATQPLLPVFATAFDISPAAANLSLSVTTATLGVAMLAAGRAADRLGSPSVMRWSLLLAAGLGLLAAAAPSFGALLLVRALQGVALAGLPAVAMSHLTREIHARSQGLAMGLFVGGNALGGMSGRLVSGVLAEVGSWRLGMLGVGLLGLLCALAFARLLPTATAPAAGTGQPATARPATGLADPALVRLYAVGGLLMGCFVAIYNALGFRLVADPYALGIGAAALVYLAYPAGSIASAGAGRLADRLGRARVLPAAVVVTAAGVLLTLAAPLPLVVVGVVVLTVGFFAAHSVASGWVSSLAGDRSATASATYLLCYYAGSSAAGPLAGQAWSSAGWPGVVVLASVLLAAALACALGLARLPARSETLRTAGRGRPATRPRAMALR